MAGDAAGAVRCACRASPRAQLSCGRLPPSRFVGKRQGSAWQPLLQHRQLLVPTQRRGRHAALSDVLRWLPLPGQADDSSSDGSGSRTNGDGSPVPNPQMAPAFADAGGDGAGYASGCAHLHSSTFACMTPKRRASMSCRLQVCYCFVGMHLSAVDGRLERAMAESASLRMQVCWGGRPADAAAGFGWRAAAVHHQRPEHPVRAGQRRPQL